MDLMGRFSELNQYVLEIKNEIERILNKYDDFIRNGLEVFPVGDGVVFGENLRFAFVASPKRKKASLAIVRIEDINIIDPIWYYEGNVPFWIFNFDTKLNILRALKQFDKYVEEVLGKLGKEKIEMP